MFAVTFAYDGIMNVRGLFHGVRIRLPERCGPLNVGIYDGDIAGGYAECFGRIDATFGNGS